MVGRGMKTVVESAMRQFTPDGPTITRLGTESEDDASFESYSYALCQERGARFVISDKIAPHQTMG